MTLLGRANKSSPFPKRTIATAAEVRGFDPAEGECCTAKKFCIDISGTPASPWNESATRVFVKSFMTVAQFKCRNRKKIHDMFRSYFRTLQRHYHKGKATATAPAEVDAKAHSRYQRKYMVSLWDRRYKIACRYRVLKDHAWILQKLGVDGMSSDEEEEGAPLRRYRVFVKPWRSKVVTEFLRILDALHRRYRQKAGAGTKRGSPPRLRYLCLDESTSKAVEKLPINAYDETWYATLKGLRKDDIAAKAPYDFTIDQSVIEWVTS
ncbi:hypothetical protein C8T65DRAFT_574203 [Cerioporus squamosus]|nr:hypothetical protein C8T65DRAFT_574203 [Cerioporus squamosus]